jgi:hypothetical protein
MQGLSTVGFVACRFRSTRLFFSSKCKNKKEVGASSERSEEEGEHKSTFIWQPR